MSSAAVTMLPYSAGKYIGRLVCELSSTYRFYFEKKKRIKRLCPYAEQTTSRNNNTQWR